MMACGQSHSQTSFQNQDKTKTFAEKLKLFTTKRPTRGSSQRFVLRTMRLAEGFKDGRGLSSPEVQTWGIQANGNSL